MRIQEEQEVSADYEPLSQQLTKNFQLRASEKLSDKPSKLTRPVSPTLHVNERIALKVKLDFSEEKEKAGFKARPLNPHLFEHSSRLPFVERKSATNF